MAEETWPRPPANPLRPELFHSLLADMWTCFRLPVFHHSIRRWHHYRLTDHAIFGMKASPAEFRCRLPLPARTRPACPLASRSVCLHLNLLCIRQRRTMFLPVTKRMACWTIKSFSPACCFAVNVESTPPRTVHPLRPVTPPLSWQPNLLLSASPSPSSHFSSLLLHQAPKNRSLS